MKDFRNLAVLNYSLKDMEGEVWGAIVGYVDEYEISNYGRVKSLQRTMTDVNGVVKPIRERILHQGIEKIKDFSPFLFVCFSSECRRKVFMVHRLVAGMFVENPKNYREVIHKDHDSLYNIWNNLEWATSSTRLEEAYAKGDKVSFFTNKFGKDSPSAKKVRMFSLENVYITTFDTRIDAAKWLVAEGFAKEQVICNITSNINKVIKGKHKYAYSHKWKDDEI